MVLGLRRRVFLASICQPTASVVWRSYVCSQEVCILAAGSGEGGTKSSTTATTLPVSGGTFVRVLRISSTDGSLNLLAMSSEHKDISSRVPTMACRATIMCLCPWQLNKWQYHSRHNRFNVDPESLK